MHKRSSIKSRLVLLAFLFLIPCTGHVQSFYNLNFEYGVYKAQPRKWAIEGEGEKYNAWLDSTISKSGNKSLYVNLEKAGVYIFLSLPSRLVAGKTISIEGQIKFQNSDSLETMLLFHNPGGSKPIQSQPIKKSNNEWVGISHTASFPANYSSNRLLIALNANGTGSFWFDNVKVKINGEEYMEGSPDFREPSKKEISALNKAAIPIKSLAINSSLKDLAPLKTIIKTSQVVALGENSHGSSTIYQLKLRLIKYMVEKEGFSIFALESPAVEADKINDYVLHGKGSLNDVIKNLVYPSWQTQDMINIIQWIKLYNQTTNSKVEFRGIDMQNGLPALEALENFARNNDTVLAASLLELKQWYNNALIGKRQWDEIYLKSETIYQYLANKSSFQYKGILPEDMLIIKRYMNIFIQSLSTNYKSGKTKSRDEYMAENVDWLIKNSNGKKIILSADNTHVTKDSGKMGSFLSKWYGENYLVFGLTYNTGTYSAYGPDKYYEVHPSYPGTYEYLFSKARFENYILDLRSNIDIPLLNGFAGFRSIGSRPQETTQFEDINIREHFDVVVYMGHSTHTAPYFK